MTVSVHKGESPTATTVRIGHIDLVFSYETIVAFAVPGYGWCVSENVWSKTTGKHLNQETPRPAHERLPHEEFKARLAIVLDALDVSDTLARDLRQFDTFGSPANLAGAGIARVEEFIS